MQQIMEYVLFVKKKMFLRPTLMFFFVVDHSKTRKACQAMPSSGEGQLGSLPNALFLRSAESTPQTASRSVQPFQHSSQS